MKTKANKQTKNRKKQRKIKIKVLLDLVPKEDTFQIMLGSFLEI